MTDQHNFDGSMSLGHGAKGIRVESNAVINDKSRGFILSVLISLNVIATVIAIIAYLTVEREARMLEYYILEIDGKLMAAGIIQPPESWSGRQHKEK